MIHYRQLTETDVDLLPEVVEILNNGLGEGYLTPAELEPLLLDESLGALFAAFDGNTLAGAGTAVPLVNWEAEDIVLKAAELGIDPPPFYEHRVGVLESSTVKPEYRRQGIASKLVSMRIEFLANRGYTAVMAVSWISGSPDNSQNVLAAAGLTRRLDYPEYWRYAEGECPACGPHCDCIGAVYFTTL